MKRLHLVNKVSEDSYKRLGITKIKGEKNQYYSCCWKFKYEDAKQLIGGSIYFHTTKSDKSTFGGRVLDAQPMTMDGNPTEYYTPSEGDKDKTQNRVYFTFEFTDQHRGQMWRGKDNTRDWTSGIIDDEWQAEPESV